MTCLQLYINYSKRYRPEAANSLFYEVQEGSRIGVFMITFYKDFRQLHKSADEVFQLPDYRHINRELLHLFTIASNRKEYLDKLVELLAERINCAMVGVRVIDKKQVAYESYRGFSESFWQEENDLSLQDDCCFCTRVIRGELAESDKQFATDFNSVYCNRLQDFSDLLTLESEDCQFRGNCVKYGFNSLAIIPIRRLDKILGAIHLADKEKDRLPLHKIKILEELVPAIAEAVYRFTLEDALRISEAGLTRAQSVANLGHWNWDLKNNQVSWSTQVYKIFGMCENQSEITYKTYLNKIHPDDYLVVQSSITDSIKTGRPYNLRHRIIRPDNSIRDVWARGDVLLDDKGSAGRMIGIVQDVTERRQELEQMHFQASLLDQVKNGVFAVDMTGRIIYWNEFAERIVKWSKDEVNSKDIINLLVPEDHQPKVEEIEQNLVKNGFWEGEFSIINKDGKIFPVEANVTLLKNDKQDVIGYAGVFNDITARKRMEKQLSHLVTHDPLTNLYNRHALEDNLMRAVALAKRGDKSVFLIIGIDNFHLVNEERGYAAGDEYLIKFASFLKRNIREADMIARLGGDEFAILLEGSYNPRIYRLADRLRYALEEETFHYNLSITVGIVLIDGTMSADQVITSAGIGLEESKRQGKNRVVIFDNDLFGNKYELDSSKMLGLIKNALKNDFFQLYYQPVFDLKRRTIAYYECLIRMFEPESREIILPGRFIPLAEKFGVMSQIDSWVFKKALTVLQENKDIALYINLSGASLGDDHLLEMIKKEMKQAKIDPKRLGFEITETAAVHDLIIAERWIKQLKDICCSFALDDFGIGFSSFSYLKLLSVDAIKIDGMFVKNLEKDDSQKTIVQAIKNVAHSMGKVTIAEFVENENVLNILKEMGIDYGQGYHLGKPSPDFKVFK